MPNFSKSHPLAEDLRRWKHAMAMKTWDMPEAEQRWAGRKDLLISLKQDGEGSSWEYVNGGVNLVSRAGRERTDLPVTEEMRTLLHGSRYMRGFGELYAVDAEGKPLPYPQAITILRRPEGREDRIRLAVYDLAEVDGRDVSRLPYAERHALIEHYFANGELVTPVVVYRGDVGVLREVWKSRVLSGAYEGLVVHAGNDVVKLKPVITQDLAVISVSFSKKHPELMGSLGLAYMDPEGRYRYAGQVGTGFSQAERKYWAGYAREHTARRAGDTLFVHPEVVIEVQSKEINVHDSPVFDSSLELIGQLTSGIGREPRFIRIREDKQVNPQDLRLTQIPNFSEKTPINSWLRSAADKRVIIMRGLPGSGKSTKAKTYGGTVVSADDYFIHDGKYQFDAQALPAAHNSAKDAFKAALERGDSLIVVDNTNTKAWEWADYERLAREHGYKVDFDIVGTGGVDIPELVERNTHGVPEQVIRRMVDHWEGDPLYLKSAMRHPERIVIPPSKEHPEGFTEKQVQDYYAGVAEKILPELKGFDILLKKATDSGLVVVRKDPRTGQPLKIETPEDFEHVNNGVNAEFHCVIPSGETTMGWIDLDPRPGYGKARALKVAEFIGEHLDDALDFREIRVFDSGGRGYHMRIYFDKPQDVDKLREQLRDWLNAEVVPNFPGTSTGRVKDGQLRLDVTTLHRGGSIRCPYSLNATTGESERAITAALNADEYRGMIHICCYCYPYHVTSVDGDVPASLLERVVNEHSETCRVSRGLREDLEAAGVVLSHGLCDTAAARSTEEEAVHLKAIETARARTINSWLKTSSESFKYDINSSRNEGRFRLRDPQDFRQDTFRRWKEWAGITAPEGVTFIVGNLKTGKKSIQTIRFDRDLWGESAAGKYWKSIMNKPGFEKHWTWPVPKVAANKSAGMEEHFESRTRQHVDRVKDYCKRIADYAGDRLGGIVEAGEAHDASKFVAPEREPYIWLTERYRCGRTGEDFQAPEGIEELIHSASEHHVHTNPHHPEYWDPNPKEEAINRDHRDAPPEVPVDATAMTDIAIAEMIADWEAMSAELGGTPRDWADKNIGVRWVFTEPQKKLIYELIDATWRDDDDDTLKTTSAAHVHIALDPAGLIKSLNSALSSEWIAYYQYWLGAKVVRGPDKAEVKSELLEHAGQEKHHADLLEKLIESYGGKTTGAPHNWDSESPCPYSPPDDPAEVSILQQNIDAESCAIKTYRGIIAELPAEETETHRVLRLILAEEEKHKLDLEKRLKQAMMTQTTAKGEKVVIAVADGKESEDSRKVAPAAGGDVSAGFVLSAACNVDTITIAFHEQFFDYYLKTDDTPEGYYITEIAGMKVGFGSKYQLKKFLLKLKTEMFTGGIIPPANIRVEPIPHIDAPVIRRLGGKTPTQVRDIAEEKKKSPGMGELANNMEHSTGELDSNHVLSGQPQGPMV